MFTFTRYDVPRDIIDAAIRASAEHEMSKWSDFCNICGRSALEIRNRQLRCSGVRMQCAPQPQPEKNDLPFLKKPSQDFFERSEVQLARLLVGNQRQDYIGNLRDLRQQLGKRVLTYAEEKALYQEAFRV